MGVRTQLIEWKAVGKTYIKADLDDAVLKAGGTEILKVRVHEHKLQADWVDHAWASWKELHESEEMCALLKAASDKLASKSEEIVKGAGKGPH